MGLTHPIDEIRWLPAEDLEANDYNPNRIHSPEWRLLERSILQTGWVQPILARSADYSIIDGFHRWRMVFDSKKVRALTRGRVPVALLDVDRPEAMLMTIRMNRAKGSHVAVKMSALVQELVNDHGLKPDFVARELGATGEEVTTLLREGIFEDKEIASWKFSKAWYPERVK